MVLKNTIDLMISEDYKERFLAEYYQLKIRHDGLCNMIDKWDKDELNFTPTCSMMTYGLQLKAMEDYLAILKERAVMEGIEL